MVLLLDPVDSSASASFRYILLMKVEFVSILMVYFYSLFKFIFLISKVGTLDFEEVTASPQASGFRIDVYNASDSSLG